MADTSYQDGSHIHQQSCHKRGHENCDKYRPCPECHKIDTAPNRIRITRVSRKIAEKQTLLCTTAHELYEYAVTRIRIGGVETLLCKECTLKVHKGTKLS